MDFMEAVDTVDTEPDIAAYEKFLQGKVTLSKRAGFDVADEVQDGGCDDPQNLWHICTICHELIHLLRRNRRNPQDRPTGEMVR